MTAYAPITFKQVYENHRREIKALGDSLDKKIKKLANEPVDTVEVGSFVISSASNGDLSVSNKKNLILINPQLEVFDVRRHPDGEHLDFVMRNNGHITIDKQPAVTDLEESVLS